MKLSEKEKSRIFDFMINKVIESDSWYREEKQTRQNLVDEIKIDFNRFVFRGIQDCYVNGSNMGVDCLSLYQVRKLMKYREVKDKWGRYRLLDKENSHMHNW